MCLFVEREQNSYPPHATTPFSHRCPRWRDFTLCRTSTNQQPPPSAKHDFLQTVPKLDPKAIGKASWLVAREPFRIRKYGAGGRGGGANPRPSACKALCSPFLRSHCSRFGHLAADLTAPCLKPSPRLRVRAIPSGIYCRFDCIYRIKYC